ncbi:MAG: hypothetical protein OEY33_02055 [Bdellovibrionales bacterium]|nr:hypothetical protein [Bdellovibrionales bacterium]
MSEINYNANSHSYVNEYKGNLLEFMFARTLAQNYGLEVDFLKRIDPYLLKTLTKYEKELRTKSPELLRKLPLISEQIFNKIRKEVPEGINMIEVVGKKAQYSKYNEADVILKGPETLTPISLKLCKDNSYVNTKSGGVKSFFTKYFSKFNAIAKHQKDLNLQISLAFEKMAFELHDYYDLPYSGGFSKEFLQKSGSELPGQINHDLKKIVHKYYHQCIEQFYHLFVILSEQNDSLFSNSLYPLLGLGNVEIWQVAVLYKKDYLISNIHLRKHRADVSVPIKIGPLKPEKSYFSLQIGPDILQIRMKPMNKYTVEGLKVNCSVKFGC